MFVPFKYLKIFFITMQWIRLGFWEKIATMLIVQAMSGQVPIITNIKFPTTFWHGKDFSCSSSY
jgi:hypothetical protein